MDYLDKVYSNIKQQVSNLPVTIPKTIDYFNKSVNRIRIPPLTKDNVLYYYFPLQGLISYTTLSVSVMNPHLMVRYVFSSLQIINVCLLLFLVCTTHIPYI